MAPIYKGSSHTDMPARNYGNASHSTVPVRKNIGCDWPYAVRRHNGAGIDSYHYQAILLRAVVVVGRRLGPDDNSVAYGSPCPRSRLKRHCAGQDLQVRFQRPGLIAAMFASVVAWPGSASRRHPAALLCSACLPPGVAMAFVADLKSSQATGRWEQT